MLIDFHVHAFVDEIAEKAVTKLMQTANIPAFADGTESDTRQKLREWGVDYGVMLPIATKPTQQHKINDWAASINHGNFICFGTIHPDAPDIREELERIKSLGLKGVKIHPDYQGTYLFDKRFEPLFEGCQDLGLPISIHMGFDPISPFYHHATPAYMCEVNDKYPDLKLIGAHMGGMYMWEDVRRYVVGRKNIWLDTSYVEGHIDDEILTDIIKKHGAEHILFASDCPWQSSVVNKGMIDRISLNDNEKELIFWKNAAEMLELKV